MEGCISTREHRWPGGATNAREQPRCSEEPPAATSARVGGRVEERLHKILAAAGVASRRAAETLIQSGRVRVNGELITRLGSIADPHRDRITVDDRPLRRPAGHVYLLLHKPVGVVTTMSDPRGRATVLDLIRRPAPGQAPIDRRVFPVGRLDYDSSGLVLLTDDGELAQRLTHPRHHVEKEYRVVVAGDPPAAALAELEGGIDIEGRRTAPARIRRVAAGRGATTFDVTLREGRNRQIRRMFDAIGHPVVRLQRTRLGPLALGRLPEGAWRPLARAELARLRRAAELEERAGTNAHRD